MATLLFELPYIHTQEIDGLYLSDIKSAVVKDNVLHIQFSDGTTKEYKWKPKMICSNELIISNKKESS